MKAFFKTLGIALGSGAVGGLMSAVNDPHPKDFNGIISSVIGGAIIGASALWLRKPTDVAPPTQPTPPAQ